MSRRQHTNGTGVSLFPFLDVLVCTMGSLILLLLVATSRIRAAAVERAKFSAAAARETVKPAVEISIGEAVSVDPEPEPEPDVDLAAAWKTQVERLAAERDGLNERLNRLQQDLDATRSNVMRTKVKSASATDQLQQVREQQQLTAAERDRLRAEISALRSDLNEAEERLVKAIERQKNASSQFAFLPFDGRTGTTKRPILIECTQEYIRFLPEDVRLTPSDLNGFTAGFNPLLIASRELVHYWTAFDRVHDAEAAAKSGQTRDPETFDADVAALTDKSHEPYVLLLVRPNGAVAFHIAKSLLNQLNVPHGYELITDDMELDAANPDPEAKRICHSAVEQVLSEREKVEQMLARNRDLRQDQLQLEPNVQTFVPTESTAGFPDPRASGNVSSNRVGQTPGASHGQSTTDLAGATPSQVGRTNGASGQSAIAHGGRSAAGLRSDTEGSGTLGNRNGIGNPKRAVQSDEPPEEPLPRRAKTRDPNDDTKPFPLSGSTRAANSATSKQGTPAGGGRSDRFGASSAAASDPRGANAQQAGGNFTRMKRKYSMPRAGIGLEKAIVLRVWSDRVLVGGQFEIPIGSSVSTESLIDRVLMAMDRVQTGWPAPAAGFHWVPTLRYEVAPGGEQVQQRLDGVLFDLGLASEVKYLAASPTKEGAR